MIVTVYNAIKSPEIIKLIKNINEKYQLNQKEMICLGIVAQHGNIIATEFSTKIQSKDDKQIKNWLGKLLNYMILLTKGRTKGMQYFINPVILKGTSFEKTDLSNIEDHRLRNLILEDLEKYHNSGIDHIHRRIGLEIPIRKLRSSLYNLVKENKIKSVGSKKFRKYFIDKKQG